MSGPLASPGFRRVTATQFLTVFNDNALKQTVLLLSLDAGHLGRDPQALAGLVFALPFLLLGVTAGDLADRLPRHRVLLAAKLAEVGILLLAAWALARESLPWGLAALGLMGAQSAFLGPAKYGILPQLLPRAELGRANGFFHGTVMVGIILGTGCAGLLKDGLGGRLWLGAVLLAALAAAGSAIAARVPPVPAADPGRRLRWNPLATLPAGLRVAAARPQLLRAMTAHALFYLAGGAFLFSWNQLGREVLHVPDATWSAGLAALSLSLAMGSLLAGRLSRHRLRTELAPLGGGMLALALLAAALGPARPDWIFAVLFLGQAAAGLLLVPLNTLLQVLPDPAARGRALGASMTLDWIAICGASLLKLAMTAAGLGPQEGLAVLAGVLLLAASLAPRTLGTPVRAGRG